MLKQKENDERLLMVEEGYLSESQGIPSCITAPEQQKRNQK